MNVDKILIISISLIVASITSVMIFSSSTNNQSLFEKISLDSWYEQHKQMEYGCKGGALQLSDHGVNGCSGVSYSQWSYDDPRDHGISVKLPVCSKGYGIYFNDTNHTFLCYKSDPNIIYMTGGGGGGGVEYLPYTIVNDSDKFVITDPSGNTLTLYAVGDSDNIIVKIGNHAYHGIVYSSGSLPPSIEFSKKVNTILDPNNNESVINKSEFHECVGECP